MNRNNVHCSPVNEIPGMPDYWMIANDGGDMGANSYSIAKGILNINNGTSPVLAKKAINIAWNLIDRENGVKVLCPQDPTAQVDTVTTITVPNADCCGDQLCYYVTLTWHDATSGQEMTHTYSACFTTGSTWTKTQVSAALIADINADPNRIVTAAAVGETFTLTATTAFVGHPFLTKTNTALQTVAHTTPNVISWGDGDDLLAMGFTAADGIDATNEYAIVEIPYYTVREGDIPSDNAYSGQRVLSWHKFWLIVETGGTAEDAVLGTSISDNTPTDSLCYILAGSSTASKYLGVINDGCPCS